MESHVFRLPPSLPLLSCFVSLFPVALLSSFFSFQDIYAVSSCYFRHRQTEAAWRNGSMRQSPAECRDWSRAPPIRTGATSGSAAPAGRRGGGRRGGPSLSARISKVAQEIWTAVGLLRRADGDFSTATERSNFLGVPKHGGKRCQCCHFFQHMTC